MQIPRRPCRHPDNGRYEMPDYLVNCWSQLEQDLTVATCLLQVHYDTPAIRPLYPFAFGYKKSHSHEDAAMKAIHKSKEWFAVWTALFSYMIAMSEVKENEVHDYSHLSKKGWADYLYEQGFQITWLESVMDSMVFDFGADLIRSGAFIHLSNQSSLQPPVNWFCTYNVPVWYPWGPEQASHPGFSKFAPPTDLLQASTTTIAKSPSHSEQSSVQESKTTTAKSSSQSEQQPSVQESSTTIAESMSQSEQQSSVQESTTTVAESHSQSEQRLSHVTTSQNAVASSIEETPVDDSDISQPQPNVVETQALSPNTFQPNVTETQAVAPSISSKDRFLASWNCFLSSRQLLRQRIGLAETSVDKQKRMARENQPPTNSAKVFHWIKDISSNGYVREQVSKRWRQHTLGEYSSKQTRYDSYLNEWDCCSELGSDDEGDDHNSEDSLEEDTPFEDYDQINAEPLAPQKTSIGSDSHLDHIDSEESPPICLLPQDASFCPSVDGLEEEVLEVAYTFWGFTPPLPPPTLPIINRSATTKEKP